jgi:hypothetical protein
MIEKMQAYKISTKTLEVVIADDNFLYERILEEMLSPDHKLAIGALKAAYEYIISHTNSPESQKLVDGVICILQYRKQPGLESAIWLLHNLVYEGDSIILCSKDNKEAIDCELYRMADVLTIRENEDLQLTVKEIIKIRRACMSLAFEMYQKTDKATGKGVKLWKELAEDNEANEVKQEWIWP